MIEIRFDKTKDEVALLIWFLVDHSVYSYIITLQCYRSGCKIIFSISKSSKFSIMQD
jgi:hypothetical protein